jgi:hypothetical protein
VHGNGNVAVEITQPAAIEDFDQVRGLFRA